MLLVSTTPIPLSARTPPCLVVVLGILAASLFALAFTISPRASIIRTVAGTKQWPVTIASSPALSNTIIRTLVLEILVVVGTQRAVCADRIVLFTIIRETVQVTPTAFLVKLEPALLPAFKSISAKHRVSLFLVNAVGMKPSRLVKLLATNSPRAIVNGFASKHVLTTHPRLPARPGAMSTGLLNRLSTAQTFKILLLATVLPITPVSTPAKDLV